MRNMNNVRFRISISCPSCISCLKSICFPIMLILLILSKILPLIMQAFFITGTDTGVGKTWFTCWLLRAWRAQGHAVAALKPISTGDRDDALLLREASGDSLSLDEINPHHFREPGAPLLAARAENRSIDFPA